MLRPRPHIRSLVALALLSLLGLGSACHLLHHILDPDCALAEQRGAQPCATCAGLHGGALAADPDIAVRPLTILVAEVAHVATPCAVAPVVPGGAPRAPPGA